MAVNTKVSSRSSVILMSLITILVGLSMMIFPALFQNTIMLILGLMALAFGLFKLIPYFMNKATATASDFTLGVTFVILGLVVIIFQRMLLAFIPIMFGIFLLITAIMKLRDAVDMKRVGAANWMLNLIFGIASVVLALILICRPGFVLSMTFSIIGAFIFVDGIMSLVSSIMVNVNYRGYRQSASQTIYDAATGNVTKEKK
ncbi:MAG: DUF308 domain-containing protein [Lachnospiraceae bacterium]|nr:DUF308 domain-containing protein [Lachnospiraceae bacterium]